MKNLDHHGKHTAMCLYALNLVWTVSSILMQQLDLPKFQSGTLKLLPLLLLSIKMTGQGSEFYYRNFTGMKLGGLNNPKVVHSIGRRSHSTGQSKPQVCSNGKLPSLRGGLKPQVHLRLHIQKLLSVLAWSEHD